MLVGQQFYFGTIRKISIGFGTIFNNIHISRFTNSGGKGPVLKTFKVPLTYAKGSKWYVHATQDIPAQTNLQVKRTLPRIGFELTGIQYDSSRQLPTLSSIGAMPSRDSNFSVTTFLKQLTPTPYDFGFDVHIATKNMDDGLQIIEQILPYFRPSFNLKIIDIPELGLERDVPVIFAGINFTDNAEGSFEDERVLEWTLSFVVKGYLYPPISDPDIIRKVIANIYSKEDLSIDSKNQIITVEVDPIDAAFDEDWEAKTRIFGENNIDSNGDPITDSNGDPSE